MFLQHPEIVKATATSECTNLVKYGNVVFSKCDTHLFKSCRPPTQMDRSALLASSMF